MKEAINESWSHQLEMLTAQKEQFEKYKTRLAVVRAEKEKAKTFLFGMPFSVFFSLKRKTIIAAFIPLLVLAREF